jgi:hypothetical protein
MRYGARMNVPERVSSEQIRASYAAEGTIRGTMRALHVSHARVIQALGRTRKAEEFTGARAVDPPRLEQGPYSWSLETIRAARDEQIRGVFKHPVRLAEALRTDDALFVAYHARLAPLSSLSTCLESAGGTRGDTTRKRALEGVIVPRTTLVGIAGTLANHGVAIGYNKQEVSEDGTRITFRHEEWPLEWVRYNASTGHIETATRGGPSVPIIHGDGFWTIYRKFGVKPWTQDACVLPAALIWAAHANGIKDWSLTSTSHAIANKIMGELPQGVAFQDAEGKLTPEAASFLTMLAQIATGQSPAGIRPSGSKTDFLSNTSTAWQIFQELTTNREKAAARVYTGTDAILGSVGGAPGVDIAQLFGVTTTIVQGDAEALEMGLSTGVYQPWAAMNDGDSRYAPSFHFELPDPDAEQESEQAATRHERLMTAVKAEKDQGMLVDQARVDTLAKRFGVKDAPVLAPIASVTVPIALAPTDVAKVVRVREARGANGLPPYGDARDDMSIPEFDAYVAAKNAPPPAAPSAPSAQLRALAGQYDESKHDRDNSGKFAPKGAGDGSAAEEQDDAERHAAASKALDADAERFADELPKAKTRLQEAKASASTKGKEYEAHMKRAGVTQADDDVLSRVESLEAALAKPPSPNAPARVRNEAEAYVKANKAAAQETARKLGKDGLAARAAAHAADEHLADSQNEFIGLVESSKRNAKAKQLLDSYASAPPNRKAAIKEKLGYVLDEMDYGTHSEGLAAFLKDA